MTIDISLKTRLQNAKNSKTNKLLGLWILFSKKS